MDDVFLGSLCHPERDVRTWRKTCLKYEHPRYPRNMYHRTGSCYPDEMCINDVARINSAVRRWVERNLSPPTPWFGKMAKCVKVEEFRSAVTTYVHNSITFFPPPPADANMGLRSWFTLPDNMTTVMAPEFELHAQSNEPVIVDQLYQNADWEDVINGTAECSNCGKVDLVPYPQDAERLVAEFQLPDTVNEAVLWIAMFSTEENVTSVEEVATY